MIIHINGWPGVGKLTVARIVADRLDAHLVDNHVILNPALAIAEHGSPAFTAISEEIRSILARHIEATPPGEIFVFTDALEEGAPVCTAIFERVVQLAEKRAVSLLSVCLDCNPAENARRLTDPRRAEQRKLTDVDTLTGYRNTLTLLRPPVDHRLDLDTTDLSPEAAADRILRTARGLLADD